MQIRLIPRIGRQFLVLSVASMLVASSQAMAADSPADAFPDNAGIVIRLKSPQKTIKKVADLVDSVQPGLGERIEAEGQGIGLAISNPAMTGVDQSKDWWVAAFPTAEAEPTVVFGIPTSDADALKDAVGDGFTFVVDGSWVYYSDDEAAAKSVEACIKGQGKAISTVIDSESKGVVDRGDISIYVNVKQLTATYKDQLEQAEQQIDVLLEQIAENAPNPTGMDLSAIFEMYGKAIHGLMAALKDSEGFALAVAIDREAVTIEEYVHVAADSGTDKFLKSNTSSEMKLLAKLPANSLGYFGMSGNMQELTKWGMQFSSTLFGADEEKTKAITDTLDELAKVDYGSYVGSFRLGNLDEGAIQGVAIVEAKPTDKMKEVSRKLIESMSILDIEGFKMEYTLKPDAETFGNHKADVITFKQEVDEALDPLGIQKKIMQYMYGPEGMTQRIVYLEDKFVQAIGTDKKIMTDALAAIEGSDTAENAALSATRKQLPAKANVLVMIDLPGTLLRIATLVIGSGELPIPIPPEALDSLKIEPSYLGFALATENQGLRAKTVVPVKQIQGIMKLVMFAQQMAPQGGGF